MRTIIEGEVLTRGGSTAASGEAGLKTKGPTSTKEGPTR